MFWPSKEREREKERDTILHTHTETDLTIYLIISVIINTFSKEFNAIHWVDLLTLQ